MRKAPTRVLLLEDNSGDIRLLQEMLKTRQLGRFALIHFACMREALNYLASNSVDIILLDLGLPDAQGLDAMRQLHAAAPRIPLIAMTGCDDDMAVDQALQKCAQDSLIEGQIETSGLLREIGYATQRKKAEVEMQIAQEAAEAGSHHIVRSSGL
jgi:CheY-like chemotaxis protein